jgi:predicted nucleic acid-binding protein
MSNLVLLDNTVLTNFALVNRADLVLGLWGEACGTTTAVLNEYQAGVESGLLAVGIWDTLQRIELDEAESFFATMLSRRLGAGERTCLPVAVHRQALLVTDDLDARHFAREHNIPTTGTVGVLVSCVRQGYLPVDQANAVLAEMIRFGYRSPVALLDSLLE